jgi:hypothetical protein
VTTTADPFGILRRVMQPRERPRPGEVCEMCGEVIAEPHSHVASVSERRLLCTCRACYLLFTAEGAGARRLRAIPDRVVSMPDFVLRQEQWDDLAIPVDLVFLFQQSDLDPAEPRRIVACYPSPAGATESELDLSAWAEIAQANPTLADVAADVEAVLVRRLGATGGYTCFVVPIDVCYELVGLVRQFWTGFQGGAEVWQHIDEFFDRLAARART